MKQVGKVTRYFSKLGVAVIELEDKIKLGDTLVFKKGETEYEQVAESIQIDNQSLSEAGGGDVIGLQTAEPVKAGSLVFFKIS